MGCMCVRSEDLPEQSGTSIIMATHDFKLLEKKQARVLTCEQGKLKDSGK